MIRRECLTHCDSLNIPEAATVLDSWKEDYNKVRPHGKLGEDPAGPIPGQLDATERSGRARKS